MLYIVHHVQLGVSNDALCIILYIVKNTVNRVSYYTCSISHTCRIELTLQSSAIEAVSGVPVLAELVVIAICPSKVGIGDDCIHDAPTNC